MSPTRIVTVALAALASGAAPLFAQTVNDPALVVQTVASGLSQPTTMAFIGPNDILVLQKADGRVRRITGGVLQAAAVLDVAVDSSSERGLLGIAVDPDFAATRHVYLSYTESSTGADTNGTTPFGNRIYRYDWNGAALVNPVLVFDLPATPGPNHNGGVIAFGPDGFLYGVIGDLNRNGKLQNISSGPDPDDTGVIWRIDATTGGGASDNPFFTPAEPAPRMNRYFAYGVRNSFGLTFDPRTGGLWDTENGPNNYDEVNRIVSGFNSGWNRLMGPEVRDPQGTSDLWFAPGAVYRDPDFSWNFTVAPTALVFPASPLLGCALKDQLLVGDNNCSQIYRFSLTAARDTLALTSAPLLDRVADNPGNRCADEMGEILFGGSFGAVTDLEVGPDGWLYVVSLSLGQVLRIGPRAGAFPDADADGVNDACDCAVSNPGAYARPGEVPRLQLQGTSPDTLFWDGQAGVTGPATTSTVVSGLAASLRTDGGYAASCDLTAGNPGTSFNDPRADPPVGDAFYYLVRAQNGCGAGTFGDGTPVPDPRDLLDSGSRPACGG
jgi:glucose/arabinose dehydrogenase